MMEYFKSLIFSNKTPAVKNSDENFLSVDADISDEDKMFTEMNLNHETVETKPELAVIAKIKSEPDESEDQVEQILVEILLSAAKNGMINGEQGVKELIVNKYVDVNAKNELGRTALHEAAKHGHFKTVRFLIANGALNSLDKNNITPMDEALTHGCNDPRNLVDGYKKIAEYIEKKCSEKSIACMQDFVHARSEPIAILRHRRSY